MKCSSEKRICGCVCVCVVKFSSPIWFFHLIGFELRIEILQKEKKNEHGNSHTIREKEKKVIFYFENRLRFLTLPALLV